MATKEDDEIMSLLHVMNHDDLLFFTNTGRVFTLPAYELPQAGRTAKGQAIVNLLQLQKEERVTAVLKSNLEDKQNLFLVTKQGTVKRTSLDQFTNIRRSGLIAQKINAGDELRWVVATSGQDELLALIDRDPEAFFKPAYYGASGWVGLILNRPNVDWDHVAEWLERSWRATAPARLTKLLDAADQF